MRQNKTFDNHIFFGVSLPILFKLRYMRGGGVTPIVERVCPEVSVKRAASMFSVTDHHFRFDIKFT